MATPPTPLPPTPAEPDWLQGVPRQKSAAPAQASGPDWLQGVPKKSGESSPEEAQKTPRKEPTGTLGYLTQSFVKTRHGEGASEKWDRVLSAFEKQLGPESNRGMAAEYAIKTLEEVSKQGAGAIDFLTSPAGAALIGLHAFPVTRPFAAVADLGLAALQGVDTLKDAKEAIKDPSPQKVGKAIASAVASYVTFSGGKEIKEHNPLPDLNKLSSKDVQNFTKTLAGVSDTQKQTRAARGVLREGLAHATLEYGRIEHSVHEARKHVDTLTDAQRFQAIHNIETSATGRKGVRQADPQTQQASDLITGALDHAWDQIIALKVPGVDQHFYENYFPRFFKEFEKAGSSIQNVFARRTFTGDQSFRHKRSILGPIRDLVDPSVNPNPNLHLVTTNFVDLGLMKIHELQKFKMALQSVRELKGQGLIERVMPGDNPTPGWKKVQDHIIPKAEIPLGGSIYAPLEVAKSINNFLAPGIEHFLRDNVGGPNFSKAVAGGARAMKGFNNATARFLVSFSGFHGVLSSFLAMTDEAANGVQLLSRGKMVDSGKAFAKSLGWAPIEYYQRGGQLMKHAMDPSIHPQFAPLLSAIERGGGRVGIDTEYRSRLIDEVFRSWEASQTKAGKSAIVPRFLKKYTNFIMETLVPKLKTGAAMRMMEIEMDRWGPDWQTKVPIDQQREVFGKIIDSIDNRHGQLIYDNLFWHRGFRDAGSMTMQFVGWTLGSYREAFGGVKDVLQIPAKALSGVPKGDLVTSRSAWTLLAMPFMSALANSVSQYYMTGGSLPQSKTDLMYPRTGQKNAGGEDERVVFPWSAYLRTFSQANPWQNSISNTVKSKVSNSVASLWSIFATNADYQNRQLWNSEDPFVKNLSQDMSFLLERMSPIALQRFEQGVELGEGSPGSVAATAIAGVSRAPVSSMRTDSENLLSKYAGSKVPQGAIDEDQFDRKQASTNLASQLAQKRIGQNEVLQAAQDGRISKNDARRLLIQHQADPWDRRGYFGSKFLIINPSQAISVWRSATMEERKKLVPLMQYRRAKLQQDNRPDYKKKWGDEIDKLLAEFEEDQSKASAPPENR